MEFSFCTTGHDLAGHTTLSLHHRRDNVFSVKMDMLVNFHGYYGRDENPAMPVHVEVDVPFIGLLVIPDNLFPRPNKPTELRKVASQFVDLSAYEGPEPWKTHGFVFRPIGFTETGSSDGEPE